MLRSTECGVKQRYGCCCQIGVSAHCCDPQELLDMLNKRGYQRSVLLVATTKIALYSMRPSNYSSFVEQFNFTLAVQCCHVTNIESTCVKQSIITVLMVCGVPSGGVIGVSLERICNFNVAAVSDCMT
ncbi:hypothetical protein Tcan_18090 [Toxocara canis]|uniref:Uncharacterized protein n=1 Tax=Toxocara canis TaxID=6265 RepID=A0A0B2UZL2_TOXCA|nr:hypothetical protein Tcan_18090 [Toxocara canis]